MCCRCTQLAKSKSPARILREDCMYRVFKPFSILIAGKTSLWMSYGGSLCLNLVLSRSSTKCCKLGKVSCIFNALICNVSTDTCLAKALTSIPSMLLLVRIVRPCLLCASNAAQAHSFRPSRSCQYHQWWLGSSQATRLINKEWQVGHLSIWSWLMRSCLMLPVVLHIWTSAATSCLLKA